MITGLLVFLVALDFVLVFAFYQLSRRQTQHQIIMREITEERTLLSELRSSIRNDLQVAQSQVRSVKEQVQVLATEAEQEVKSGIAQIAGEVDGIISQLSTKFDGPMELMSEKQHYLEHLSQRVQTERKAFGRIVERAESLARFFQEGVRFDDVMKDLEDKKFADIRALVAQGLSHGKIARELGVSEQEVKTIAGFRY